MRGWAAVWNGQRRLYQPGGLDNDDVVRHGDVTGSARVALSHNTRSQTFEFHIISYNSGIPVVTAVLPLPVVYWGVYAGIRRIPTSGFF